MTREALKLVEKITNAAGYTQRVGMQVVAVDVGKVEMAINSSPDVLQFMGVFHGGVIAALADHAGGAAVTSALPEGRIAVTVCLQINYMTPAKGEAIVARAEAIQVGKTIGVAQVQVVSLAGGVETSCAAATVTLMAVAMPK